MEKEIIITDDLIAKYLTGEASPDEAMALQEWKAIDVNDRYYSQFELTWSQVYAPEKTTSINKEIAWSKISSRLPQSRQVSFYEKNKTILRIAASVIVALTVGVITFLNLKKDILLISRVTTNEIERIQLPDASVATLSRDSKIEYVNEFEGKERELTLQGEAFFKVTPNKEKPFVIHTEAADIKVVGTSFNVVTNNGRLEVSVIEGKVLIISEGKEQYLEAGMTGVIEKSNESIEVKNSVDINKMGYATHQFSFKATPLREVFKDFEKSFPYSIEVTNKAIENCTLTATFEGESAEDILAMVAISLDLVVSRDGQTFVLQGKGCP